MSKIPEAVVHRRAELLYQQLDGLQALRRNLRPEFLAESRKHKAAKLLRRIPCIGPIRAARLLALIQTPHRLVAVLLKISFISWVSADNCNAPKTMQRLASTLTSGTSPSGRE